MGGLETTYEPILLGSAVAFMYVSFPSLYPLLFSETMDSLSGIVAIQCLIYFKLYSNDVTGTKVLVRFMKFFEIGVLTDHALAASWCLKVGAVWYV